MISRMFGKDEKNDDLALVTVLYDSRSELYSMPHFHRNRGLAERAFMEGLRDPQSMLVKYPGDFTMFEIGVYDERNGTFQTHEAKINLGTGLDFLRRLSKIQEEIASVQPQQNGVSQ